MNTHNVRAAQAPLRQRYARSPGSAMVTDHATTDSQDHADPFHAIVSPMPSSGVTLPVGVHQALGGLHDAPTPGDILCAALSSCMDSSLRMVANSLGIRLQSLQVSVTAKVDVRGTLMISRSVPVGFQEIHCAVQLEAADGTDERLLKKLYKAAEYSCVVLKTLQNAPTVNTTFNGGTGDSHAPTG